MPDSVGKVKFDDGTFLDENVLYCGFCLATVESPNKAITVMGGEAVCSDHFYIKSEVVEYYAAKHFEKLRERNLKELK